MFTQPGQFDREVKTGNRFRFGRNWRDFLNSITPERIKVAENSLLAMLEVSDLRDKTFLDAGCGSGLFSLAAINLGAKVHSFDFDPDSVECARILKEKHHPSAEWIIEQGSVIDTEYMDSLGRFDYVYSWGVLHHTGNLSLAMKTILRPLKRDGRLFIGLYNDQGKTSDWWKKVKRTYNSGMAGKIFISGIFIPKTVLRYAIPDLLNLRSPLARYREYKKNRGMSLYHDWIDWLGGLPFEVAKPAEVIDFYKRFGLVLTRIKTTNGPGINEFVLTGLPALANGLETPVNTQKEYAS